MRVEVVYLGLTRSFDCQVAVPEGARARDAIAAVRLLELAPELAGANLDVGIFNHPCGLDEPLREGDRVEIYRPLTIDPKQARRVRAEIRRRRARSAAATT